MVDIIAAIKNLKKIFGLPAKQEELPWPVIEPMAPAEEVLLTTGRPWKSIATIFIVVPNMQMVSKWLPVNTETWWTSPSAQWLSGCKELWLSATRWRLPWALLEQDSYYQT